MTVFVVIPTGRLEVLEHSINSKFPAANKKLPNGEWLVAFPGTAIELSNELGITPDGKGGLGMVLAITSYYGRAPTDVWEWITTRWEK